MDKKCSYATFEAYFNNSQSPDSHEITVDCEDGYIGDLISFGFLYQFDKKYGGDSVASERCNYIQNPYIRYKKPVVVYCLDDPDLAEEEQIPNCVPKPTEEELQKLKEHAEAHKLVM